MLPPYDRTDRNDILRHAKLLIGKRLAELYSPAELATTSGKGTMGQLVQSVHFGLPADNRPAPDFEEAGVELKVTGLKRLVNGELRVKERLVLSIIDFESIVHETFPKSSFLQKNALILLLCYLYEKGNAYFAGAPHRTEKSAVHAKAIGIVCHAGIRVWHVQYVR